jgi:hypothetical protein
LQFTPIWNWYYEHFDQFKKLNKAVGFNASVYGEWLYYRHTIYYDRLPSYFVAYDIYDHENGYFMASQLSRKHLQDAGFNVTPLLQLSLRNFADLDQHLVRSPFSDENREGLVVKVCDDVRQLARFKMVRGDYRQGLHFGESRNTLGTPHPYEEPAL